MKNIIMGAAMILLLSMILTFQQDMNAGQRRGMMLRETANEAADAAALFRDADAYSDGYVFFDMQKGIEAAGHIMGSCEKECRYTLYFFCMSRNGGNTGEVYKSENGGAAEQISDFSFGDPAAKYIEEKRSSGENAADGITVRYPSVICVADAGHAEFSLKSIETRAEIIKTGIYEYKHPDAYTGGNIV